MVKKDFGGLITMSASEYRTCIVGGKKALFHRWHEFCNLVDASIAVGGHPGGQIKYTLGTVEFEDGTIQDVAPHSIRFTDNFVNRIWEEEATTEGCAENG
jgi:hypothetical protein